MTSHAPDVAAYSIYAVFITVSTTCVL